MEKTKRKTGEKERERDNKPISSRRKEKCGDRQTSRQNRMTE